MEIVFKDKNNCEKLCPYFLTIVKWQKEVGQTVEDARKHLGDRAQVTEGSVSCIRSVVDLGVSDLGSHSKCSARIEAPEIAIILPAVIDNAVTYPHIFTPNTDKIPQARPHERS